MKDWIIRIDEPDGFYYYHPYGRARTYKEAYRMSMKDAHDKLFELRHEKFKNEPTINLELIQVT